MEKRYNNQYVCMQGIYWMVYCLAVTFAATFHKDKGYSDTVIGVVIGLANIFAVVLQVVLSKVADRFSEKGPIAVIGSMYIVIIVINSVLLLVSNDNGMIPALMTVFIAFSVSLQPFVNAFCFYLEKRNVRIKFGIARGIGSLTYAVVAAIIGKLILSIGVKAVNIFAIVFAGFAILLMTVVTVSIRKHPVKSDFETIKKISNIDSKNGNNERGVILLLVGTVFIFFAHAFINNFTLQIVENVGGNSSDMGNLQAFSALLELPAMFFFDRLCKKIDFNRLLSASVIFFVAKIAFTTMAGSLPMLYISMLFQSVSFAVFIPAGVRFMKENLPENRINNGQALFTGMITIGNIIASLSGGFMLDGIGMFNTLLCGTVTTVFGAALVFITSMKNKIS